MTDHVLTRVANGTGIITLDRPKALNSLSLAMVRRLTDILLAWRDDAAVDAVVLASSSEKALCAGGDIRFFHEAGHATPTANSALLEDFFTEEYALNHLIHFYPKPYIAIMDGVVMGGGMGIAQGGPDSGLRIVTERTKMAMPEVNIGLFPDVGGSHFLSHAPGQLGNYLGLTGLTIGAADALYVGLADVFVPGAQLGELNALISATPGAQLAEAIRTFAARFTDDAGASTLETQRSAIDRHFGAGSVTAIMNSLAGDEEPFAQKALAAMRQRSPLMMCVTHQMLVRGATLSVADCLRMERSLVRRNFEHGEVLEGVRALVIDKDNAPQWNPPTLDAVTPEMVDQFFAPVWPDHAHPLRHLS
ncbi:MULTISPECIES: enoyl-CoA hydratase/isomerase family protein [unclassified Massilia]|uniref:enoyl-CoA hydratase/isomerase family protein n=1 Tax=unclassified Massilia TaxID=2609279 RepID=UPI00177CEEFC|nr:MULTISPECIES: enoyl-CoA hydratase/isomerase family protein [unclassified Massilia]MBD8529718.1 enoyl-CoA hydratase/isomerase family protein [Massilia sp. CFBP 13647]MBD8673195.1 enoyl-CoA hydratase/isomerase family protein [Massilia sp. CFBP 13721]